MARDPSLRPTTAMKRVMQEGKDWDASSPTLIRRWQAKWKREGGALIAAARERARPKPSFGIHELIRSLDTVRRQFEQTFRDPNFQRTLATAASVKLQLEKQLEQPVFQHMVENAAKWQAQLEQALKQLELQPLIEWQRQVRSLKGGNPFGG
jgi:hypothetical protein